MPIEDIEWKTERERLSRTCLEDERWREKEGNDTSNRLWIQFSYRTHLTAEFTDCVCVNYLYKYVLHELNYSYWLCAWYFHFIWMCFFFLIADKLHNIIERNHKSVLGNTKSPPERIKEKKRKEKPISTLYFKYYSLKGDTYWWEEAWIKKIKCIPHVCIDFHI